jgi:prepilin-type N-terminal cleavage/methylation domain-containing protein
LERRSGGFSLPELLAVIALVGIALAIGIPLIHEQVQLAEVRGAADELALHLRAARMISVAQHRPVTFTSYPDPTNKFTYAGMDGQLRTIFLQDGIRIAPESDATIVFKQNGSIDVTGSVIIESDVSGARERWTAAVSTLGIVTLTHARVS